MFKTVLLPIDLEDASSWTKALPAARSLCEPGGVLHVMTVLPDFGMAMVGTFFKEGFEERALHDIGEKLSEWVRKHVPEEIEVHPHVLHGRVYEEIMNAADKLDVDAIVVASHRPGLTDYLLGPNAARVVRHAKQSVFVVRGK
ncbi:MAG: universal stress protein [Pseudomonadota bacterium]